MRTVGSGIDTLCVGYGTNFYNLSLSYLREKKAQAQQERDSRGVPIDIKGYQFTMMPRGSNGYEYTIMNSDVTVNIATNADGGKFMPEIYVRYSAALLAKNGLNESIRRVNAMVAKFGRIVSEKVSRVDIRHDTETEMPKYDLFREVVTRARSKVEHITNLEMHMSGRKVTGYSIGKGDLMCRIYDKTLEIEKSGKEFFHTLWYQQGWQGGTVVRTEFQLRREVLKQFGINTTDDLKHSMPDLWKYCTEKWLRIVEPSTDKNVNRWNTAEYWKHVQKAVIAFGQVLGLLKYRIRSTNFENLYSQMMGCAKTCAALLTDNQDISAAARILRGAIAKTMRSPDWKNDAIARVAGYASI